MVKIPEEFHLKNSFQLLLQGSPGITSAGISICNQISLKFKLLNQTFTSDFYSILKLFYHLLIGAISQPVLPVLILLDQGNSLHWKDENESFEQTYKLISIPGDISTTLPVFPHLPNYGSRKDFQMFLLWTQTCPSECNLWLRIISAWIHSIAFHFSWMKSMNQTFLWLKQIFQTFSVVSFRISSFSVGSE